MKVKIDPIKLAVFVVKNDMNTEQLSKQSGVGLSTMSKIRTGSGNCKLETAVRLANALGVEVTDLLED